MSTGMNMKKIRVLIVDDSAVVRETLKAILESDDGIEVMGTAADPFFAAEHIKKEIPDVIILDIEMPRMDGLTFLDKIMSQHPIPVVICSSLVEKNCEMALRAIELGAVEIITKPKIGIKQFLEESQTIICDIARSAAKANIRRHRLIATKKLTADSVLPARKKRFIRTTEKIVAVGASTGGTEALRIFLEAMPEDSPGIVIVQHMPEKFTTAFAARLNQICRIEVKEASTNDTIIRGRALIAPGGRHTMVKHSGTRYYVEVVDGPLVSRHKPSVDVLFRSASQNSGPNAVAIIMTGMGDDGARGMKEMKDAGAFTIAQDEETCVVFGMPNEAIKLGCVDVVLPLELIASKALEKSG